MTHGGYFARPAPGRLIVLVVICIGHLGLIVILDSSSPKRKRPLEPEQEPLLVTFIDELREALPAPSSNPPITPLPREKRRPQIDLPTVNLPEVPETSTAPSTIPFDDMRSDLGSVAREAVARQLERESLRQPGVAPKGMGPPPEPGSQHVAGDTEHREGGEVITWISDRCYYTNKPPPGPDLGPLRLNHPICRSGKPQYEDFETWRKSKAEIPDKDRPWRCLNCQ